MVEGRPMRAAVIAGCTLLGLAVGSFLSVVIRRVPRGLSVFRPRSQCPGCEHPIRPAELIPLVSYVRLRRRCRRCEAPIPVRYPLMEVAGAVLFAAVAVRFDWSWDLPAFLVFFAALLAISVIDLEHYLIHNRLLAPVTGAGVVLVGLAAVGQGDGRGFARAVSAAAVALVGMFVLHLASPRGMGMGDVKFAFVLGLHLGWLGWGELAGGLFLASSFGAIAGLALVAAGRRTRKQAVPFGPFLALGAVVTVLWGEPLFRWYGGG